MLRSSLLLQCECQSVPCTVIITNIFFDGIVLRIVITLAGECVEHGSGDSGRSGHEGLKEWSVSMEMNCQDAELQEIMDFLATDDDDETPPVDTIDKASSRSTLPPFPLSATPPPL